MSELRKAKSDHVYFLTSTVVGWIDVFTRREYCEILLDSLQYSQQNKSLEIYAYVIMPSHLHLVARRSEGSLSDFLRDFKSFTAKTIMEDIEENPRESRKEWLMHMFRFHAKYQAQNKELMFWQKTNHPIELDSPSLVDQKIDYVHQNPVTAGIVTDDSYYVYSSANPLSRLKVHST